MSDFRNAPLRIDGVVLTVHDLDRVRGFYADAIGLDEIAATGDVATLGVGNTALLELRRDPHARARSPREAGLFHTAFLLPTRADLGRWLRHAGEKRLDLQGASDHAVSEAIYLSDPENNGVEIYADRPSATWRWTDGMLAMRTDLLDADDLLRRAGPARWSGVPEGAAVGHVHLQVGEIAAAEKFYGTILGLDLTTRYPGASFFSSGGYHHHLAANVWNSRNAGPRAFPSTGLADVRARLSDFATLKATGDRATAGGLRVEPHPSGLSLRDPWNTSITLTGPAA